MSRRPFAWVESWPFLAAVAIVTVGIAVAHDAPPRPAPPRICGGQIEPPILVYLPDRSYLPVDRIVQYPDSHIVDLERDRLFCDGMERAG